MLSLPWGPTLGDGGLEVVCQAPGAADSGEDAFKEKKQPPRRGEDEAGCIAILDARAMGPENETAAIAVDEGVALAALDLCCRVMAAGQNARHRIRDLATAPC